ncbi:AraC family transcriptional regulator [Clostridium bowmanii]
MKTFVNPVEIFKALFYDQSHFSRAFKAIVGVSPRVYRNCNYA